MQQVIAALEAHPFPVLNLGDRRTFVENLLFIHALIVASEPLIEEVLKRPMANGLRAFYAEHLEEERGHASSLHADLKFLGVTPHNVDWRAAQIAGLQYYLVRHAPPEALLGYMAALECRPMPLDVVATLENTHGKEALRTLRYHAEHDIAHGADLLRVIETAGHEDLVAYNAAWTACMLMQALEALAHPAQRELH